MDFNIKVYQKYQKQKGGFLREYVESGGTFKRGESPDFSKIVWVRLVVWGTRSDHRGRQ